MPRNTPLEYETSFTTDVNIPTTTETVIATLSGVSTYAPGQPIEFTGWVQLLIGASTTAITMRVRQGVDATGTLVGEANPVQISSAAGSTEEHEIQTRLTPSGEIANGTFVLTVQQTAATGAGTASQGKFEAACY